MPKNSERKQKRKFHGNRFTNAACENHVPNLSEPGCSRAKKVKDFVTTDDVQDLDVDEDNYFLIINFKTLKHYFENLAFCPECKLRLDLNNDHGASMGFANKLKLACSNCGWSDSFFTSEQCAKSEKKQGRNIFEVNLRTVLAFREIGKGHEAIATFSRCMNMRMLSDPAYRNINNASGLSKRVL